jgi:hypothetical protein
MFGVACAVQGLMNAIVIEERDGVNAYDVCMRLKDNGLLVSPDDMQSVSL